MKDNTIVVIPSFAVMYGAIELPHYRVRGGNGRQMQWMKAQL